MAGVLQEIRKWAGKLKYWEQATLEKIATAPKLTEDDYNELANLWQEDAGLAPVPPGRPRLRLSDQADAAPHQRVHLSRLHNLNEVNALPHGQELPFSPGLTLIFGANGAGKTGYARPLGCASFTRGNTEVLPNAEERKPRAVPSADIEIQIEGNENPTTLHWEAGRQLPELAGFYVFDAQSPDAHLVGPNAMSAIPSALELLTRLADETDEVRRRVQARIDRLRAPHSFAASFQGDSPVSRLIANLGPDTNLAEVRALAATTREDEAEIKRMETELARLKAQTNAQRLRSRRQELSDLEGLLQRAQKAASATDEANEAQAKRLIEDLQERQGLAEKFGAEQFARKPLRQTGTDVWRAFAAAAKRLAQAEQDAMGRPYPQEGDPCLLCQQSLPHEANDLVNRLWQFLGSDAQSRVEEARRACEDKIRELKSAPAGYFGKDSTVRRLLEESLPSLVPALEAHADSAAQRAEELAEALQEGKVRTLPPLVSFDPADLVRLTEMVRNNVLELSESKEGERLVELEASLQTLLHRKTLATQLPMIEDYVRGTRWARQAARELGTTAHITRKYNELFESLVTDRYKASLQTLLDRFGRNLRVSAEMRGRKGQTIRQIALRRTDFPSDAPASKVLSDGEKRAVALADFLAEAETDDLCDGLILDDPVTSFDAAWKRELAAYLVEQAGAGRQVVVFTHDLPFLYLICTAAAESGIERRTHWVEKRHGRPGFLFADSSPASEKEFKTAKYAEACLERSKDLPPVEQQHALEQGFDALRTTYEALVVFELFGGVVQRFEERLRIDLLEKVRFDSDAAHEITRRWGELSRYIGAHLHSDHYAPEKPTPDKLREEIEAFNALRTKLRQTKKSQAQRP